MEALPPPERLVLSEAPAENWTKFRQRMELYFKATTTTPERTKAQKAATFLHVAACCKARKSVQQVDYHNAPQERTEESDDEFQVLVVSVNDVSRNSEWVIATKLANHDTKLKVDTGAQANLLPHSLVLKLGKTATTRPSATVLTGHDGGVIKHFGVVTLPLRIGEIEEPTDFFVVKKGKQALLGLDTCERFGLISRAQCLQVQGHLESRIVSEFPQLFSGLGCLKETCSLRLEEGATPVALPARRVPYCIREPMRTELARMERHGIIEKVEEPSDWYVAGKDLQLADALSRIAGSDNSASQDDSDYVTIHATSVLNTLVSPAMMYRLAEETKADDDLRHSVVNDGILSQSLSLLVFPFLPASNLFFPVGFVVAERVLYMPSMGFCLLVAHGWHLMLKNYADSRLTKNFLWFGLLFLLTMHSLKTFVRNFEWESEYSIFMAGLKVNSQNAKLYNNVGHALEGQGDYARALEYFLKAASVQPDDIGAHMNVGRTYNNLLMFEEAEAAFIKAKDLLPRPKPGEPYKARIAPNHLNVFLNLANLISRNNSRLEEADGLYRQAISMRVDYIQAYINRGDILIKLNRTKEAQEVYERALSLDATNPDILYNLGVVFLEQGRPGDALMYFNKALELDPDHEQALMNSAILIQESGNSKLRQLAFERLELLLNKGRANERVYFNLGMLSMDDKKVEEAEQWFHLAIQVKNDFRSALFNLALLLTDSNRPLEAVPHLQKLLQYHPDHIKGLILLGDIYINHMKDLDKAQQCYERILSLQPDHVQALHNLCVVQVERGALYQAEACLLRALKLAPGESYVAKHLAIVRNRIHRYQEHLKKASSRTTTSSSLKQAAQSSSRMT
ncbi:protein O-mannosyl-transferase Tmtc3 [Rhipicephalus sanguineus]|uniref:protein O-mannosyl-transferase Tmtc3 n=1 Tax=Rhipicephalus sanguineus TaxID=34632 RepID=UPI0020C578CD|nr:protein O-mannosyl-transferase Tmtc3 [Rhipicephalus sanguineus]